MLLFLLKKFYFKKFFGVKNRRELIKKTLLSTRDRAGSGSSLDFFWIQIKNLVQVTNLNLEPRSRIFENTHLYYLPQQPGLIQRPKLSLWKSNQVNFGIVWRISSSCVGRYQNRLAISFLLLVMVLRLAGMFLLL